MGWNDPFQGMPWLRRFIALLALTVLVLGALSTPAIPDLSESTSSQADDVLLSEDDQRADPITRPAPWQPGLQSTAIALLARTLSEPSRGFPPVKTPVPFVVAEHRVTLPALLGDARPDVDRRSSIQISAIGSARTPTGPPLLIV